MVGFVVNVRLAVIALANVVNLVVLQAGPENRQRVQQLVV